MHSFEKRYRLPFPRTDVYAAWIDERTVFPPVERLEIEARVGGVYRLIMPGGFCMNGRFADVRANERLRYSWRWDGDASETEVEVTFMDVAAAPGDSAEPGLHTDIRLHHGEFADQDALERHAEGWDAYMRALHELLAR